MRIGVGVECFDEDAQDFCSMVTTPSTTKKRWRVRRSRVGIFVLLAWCSMKVFIIFVRGDFYTKDEETLPIRTPSPYLFAVSIAFVIRDHAPNKMDKKS